jgi:hypothetical protein
MGNVLHDSDQQEEATVLWSDVLLNNFTFLQIIVIRINKWPLSESISKDVDPTYNLVRGLVNTVLPRLSSTQ